MPIRVFRVFRGSALRPVSRQLRETTKHTNRHESIATRRAENHRKPERDRVQDQKHDDDQLQRDNEPKPWK